MANSHSPVETDPDAEEDEREEKEDGEDADYRDLEVREERPAKKVFNGPSPSSLIHSRCFFHAYKLIGPNER